MTVSSRTPEGTPNHCPVCRANVRIEPSSPCGDAPCPNCGHLLWFVQTPSALFLRDSRLVSDRTRRIVYELCSRLLREAGAEPDSLDVVELVMEFEAELRISIPDEVYSRIRTVDDLIVYLMSFESKGEAN